MKRELGTILLTFGLLISGCASDDTASPGANTGGSSGTGGAASGGSSSGGSQSGGSGGAVGTGGSAATGGSVGTGGTGGSADVDASVGGSGGTSATGGGSGTDDGAVTDDAPAVSDATAMGDGNPGGDTLPGKPWIHLCPKDYTHEQCCMFLCSCLDTVCIDSPMDKPGIDACMTKCPALTDMLLRCHVYHCYESLNPSVPQDHDSHCGHASGRVGGGGCPTAVYQ